MISLSLGFIIFIISFSIIILLSMKLIFVTKKELDNKIILFKNEILSTFKKDMEKFTHDVQEFINFSIKDKIEKIDLKIDKICQNFIDNATKSI